MVLLNIEIQVYNKKLRQDMVRPAINMDCKLTCWILSVLMRIF